MLNTKVGDTAPMFALSCVSAQDAGAQTVRLSDYAGRWLMLIFYPRDFTFVCPTELTAFSARHADFAGRDCSVLAISADSISLHREWLTTPPADGGLGPLQYPLASDPAGTTAQAFGVWMKEKGVSSRGLFLIDPDGILQYAVVHNLSVGRNPDEVLRVLDALQNGGLCPASWTAADGTIDPEEALRAGTILGHYRIRTKLGNGTFGTVFAAWDLRLERMVALKVLKRSIFESREAVLTESRAAAKVNHPHVCAVYAVEEEDGLPVLAMEYIDGQPLSQMITADFSQDAALKLASQIASGLAAAHSQGVVHGDLKPANIMVTAEGQAKILDFGLANSQHASTSTVDGRTERPVSVAATDVPERIGEIDETLECSGPTPEPSAGIQGTPAYMSPEQALGSLGTPASDVFSFGLLMFEMLTGRRASSGTSPIVWILRLRDSDVSAELGLQVGEDWRGPMTAMLARDPRQRPSMNQILQMLTK